MKLCAINARNRWEEEQYTPETWQGIHHIVWKPLPKAIVQLVINIPHKRRSKSWTVYGQVEPDTKNLEAALKSCIDALTARDRGHGCVGAGILVDDGPEIITWLPTVVTRDGPEEQVKIHIQEVQNERR